MIYIIIRNYLWHFVYSTATLKAAALGRSMTVERIRKYMHCKI